MKITEVKKKNGTIVYRASVYLGVDQVTGKKVKTKVTGRTQKEVKQKAKQEKIAFEKAGSTRFKATVITSYQELAALWWESYKHTVKPNTQYNTKKILDKHLIPLFGNYKLEKITTPLIQSIINKLADKTNKGEAGAYLHYDKIHALNKRVLQYGVTMQAINSNPARDVVLPRNTQKDKRNKIKHFENQDLKKFLDYLDCLDCSIYKNLYEVTLYKFLLATGCRVNEALALNWSDIDLNNGTISITKTLNRLMKINSPKSKTSQREIDIDQDTINLLKSYQLRQTQEAWQLGRTEKVVFSNLVTGYANYMALSHKLARNFKKAGVPIIGFHGFRHTHASLLLNAGIPYKELQYRLGHTTLSMTMDIYSHLSKENVKKAVSFYETALKAL